MACDCIEKVTKKMAEKLKELNPDYTILDAAFKNKGFSLNGGGCKSYNEVKIEYTFPKVNGQISSPKSTTMDAYGEYCQFCGKKHNEEEEVTDGL